MKLLFLDIEISPTLATVWGLFNQNIGIHSIVGNSEVLTWAAKWANEDEVIYSSLGMTSKKKMLKEVHKLLSEADAVVTYNGDKFDLKILNQEFMMSGMSPPDPYRSIDLYKVMKNRFRGTSNKMDYWLSRLDLTRKLEHRGHQLWLDCMNGDKEAFAEMEEYNIGDVTSLQELYDFVLPWIHNHPNLSVLYNDFVCPKCGSSHVQKRGSYYTNAGQYQRYQCQACGDWSRGTKNLATTERLIHVR